MRIRSIKSFLYTLVIILLSCDKTPVKKESWAVIINFFSPDPGYYPETKKFPFPDSMTFASLESFFTNQDKAPVITDSAIIFYDNYTRHGERLCCQEDTLALYIDTINGKKYLFAIGEYTAVFLSDTNSTTNLRKRHAPGSLALWGVRLNTPYSNEQFKEEYEKLGARFVTLDERIDEVYRQKWLEDDRLLVETIQFSGSPDRMITQLYKEMGPQEADSVIKFFKEKFPQIRYEEVSQKSEDGDPLRIVRMTLNGLVVSLTQDSASAYSCTITDYYETIRLIIKNEGRGYIYRDDIKIY